MRLFHATTVQRLAAIRQQGLLVSKADGNAKIKGVWVCTASNRSWAILHTQRKHKAQLADVVVIEVTVAKSHLTRFKKGFYYSKTDVPASRIGQVTPGENFGQSLSD
jgi:hypothetical protein